jgi:hypothetical protein
MKSYKLLILTPATLRSDIFRYTLRSFRDKMFPTLKDGIMIGGKNRKQINVEMALHVDGVGNTDTDSVLNITFLANTFFKVRHCKHEYDNCSFSKAFHWLWLTASRAGADFVFYLEDDWELLEEVDLFDMIDVIESFQNLASLRLPFRPTDLKFSKNWRHLFPWNGRFFICPETDKKHIGWCGHPNIVRPRFIREVLPFLSPDYCPERQIKGLEGGEMKKIVEKWDYGVFGIPAGPAYVKDLGRVWRSNRGIVKMKDTSWNLLLKN